VKALLAKVRDAAYRFAAAGLNLLLCREML